MSADLTQDGQAEEVLNAKGFVCAFLWCYTRRTGDIWQYQNQSTNSHMRDKVSFFGEGVWIFTYYTHILYICVVR